MHLNPYREADCLWDTYNTNCQRHFDVTSASGVHWYFRVSESAFAPSLRSYGRTRELLQKTKRRQWFDSPDLESGKKESRACSGVHTFDYIRKFLELFIVSEELSMSPRKFTNTVFSNDICENQEVMTFYRKRMPSFRILIHGLIIVICEICQTTI